MYMFISVIGDLEARVARLNCVNLCLLFSVPPSHQVRGKLLPPPKVVRRDDVQERAVGFVVELVAEAWTPFGISIHVASGCRAPLSRYGSIVPILGNAREEELGDPPTAGGVSTITGSQPFFFQFLNCGSPGYLLLRQMGNQWVRFHLEELSGNLLFESFIEGHLISVAPSGSELDSTSRHKITPLRPALWLVGVFRVEVHLSISFNTWVMIPLLGPLRA